MVDGAKLFASNVKLNRFDELKLDAQERVLDQKVGAAVAVVITNQRIAAYGVLSGWRSVDRVRNEQIESITAEDFAGVIVTTPAAELRRSVRRLGGTETRRGTLVGSHRQARGRAALDLLVSCGG